ncbi:uncharacterized protein [Dysidea avara]|uniref:uncharacterized protein isoform X3 n=1 Tax=Dysidea avara TaxID=196820 RepID=UPI003316C60B
MEPSTSSVENEQTHNSSTEAGVEKQLFKVDDETVTFGTVNSKGDYKPKSNFTIKLEVFVEAGAHTGYFVTLKRKLDGRERLCYYTTESLLYKQRFIQELRTTFKSGGLACALSERELTEFHTYLEKSFPFSDQNRVKEGLTCVGKQPASDGNTIWVLSPEVHIDSSGVQVPLCESKYAWQPIGGPNIELAPGRAANLSLTLKSDITMPLESSVALNQLLESMKGVFKHNFVAGVFSIAAGIMAMHYDTVLELNGSCLIPFLFGETETGKSTAIQCALSIFGQKEVSHLMKTKGTSDSLCLERIQKSSLPFALDDPKRMEDIGDMLIQLCNGKLTGNLRTGLHRPRSIPLLCCNFNVSSIRRYSSRALLVPFEKPAVGPVNDQETRAFNDMAAKCKTVSSAVGWAISLENKLKEEKAYLQGDLFNRTIQRLPGVDPRLVTGYTVCLYFAEKLADESRFGYLKEELEQFIEERVLPILNPSPLKEPTQDRGDASEEIVRNTVEEAIEWAIEKKANAGMHVVLQSLRTGITFQGRKAIAVCLDDMSGILTSSPADIREAVRNSKSGGTHVARDFVPKQSTRCLIKRGLNSRSRKSTVIWEDVLPESLSLAANDGLCTTVLVDCCMFLNTATIVEVPRRPTTPPATQYGNGSVLTMGSNGGVSALKTGGTSAFTQPSNPIYEDVQQGDSSESEGDDEGKQRPNTRSNCAVPSKKWKKHLDPNNPLD